LVLKEAEGGAGILTADDTEDSRLPQHLADIQSGPYPELDELVGNQHAKSNEEED
jgi:hypothetical protein